MRPQNQEIIYRMRQEFQAQIPVIQQAVQFAQELLNRLELAEAGAAAVMEAKSVPTINHGPCPIIHIPARASQHEILLDHIRRGIEGMMAVLEGGIHR